MSKAVCMKAVTVFEIITVTCCLLDIWHRASKYMKMFVAQTIIFQNAGDYRNISSCTDTCNHYKIKLCSIKFKNLRFDPHLFSQYDQTDIPLSCWSLIVIFSPHSFNIH